MQFVIVDIQHIDLILVGVHRRPYATNVEQFKEALIHIIEPYACRKMYLFGDFNLESSSASNLAELLRTYHLHRLNDEFTTEGQTNIDLVFCSENLNMITIGGENVFSYHKPIVLLYN